MTVDEGRAVIAAIEARPTEHLVLENDKFRKYALEFPLLGASTKYTVDVISPATDRDVAKYQRQRFVMKTETYATFVAQTARYIASIPEREYAWIFNILDGVAERENILLETPEYVGVLDYKWDKQNPREVYGLILVRDHALHSLRALTGAHLPMLRDMGARMLPVLAERFGLAPEEVVTFVHYIPSFWHFHVHFCSIYSPFFQGANVTIGRAIPLDSIIQSLETDPAYYQKVALRVKINLLHPLIEYL